MTNEAVYLICVDAQQGLYEFVQPEHVADLEPHIEVEKYYKIFPVNECGYGGYCVKEESNQPDKDLEITRLRDLFEHAQESISQSCGVRERSDDEASNAVTFDKRDLFDFVRAAIIDALETQWDSSNRAHTNEEAYNRTHNCLKQLYPVALVDDRKQ